MATRSTAAGAGFTSRVITGDGNIAEDRLVTTAGNYTASAALTSGTWVAQLVAFRTPPAADTTPPTAPGNLTAAVAGATQINLAWTAASDDVGVTRYQVERCAGSGCTTFVQVLTPAGTSVSDTGLVPGTSYSYRVRALDAAGNLSGYSTTATATLPATVTATVIVANKPYDGTASATVTACTLAGVIAGDTVVCTAGSATFASSAAGAAKPVTVTGVSLSGTNAGNYTLSSPTTTTTADITAAPITPTVMVADKPYDATTSATLTACALSGVIGSDVVTCAGGTATFDTPSVGTGKLVTVTGLALSGPSAANYALTSGFATTTAAITPVGDTAAPTVPGTFTAVATSATQINLNWTAATDNVGVTGYQVERCIGVSCGTFVLTQTVSGLSATDAGLTPATAYRYRVRATDAAGNLSGYSTIATAVTAGATAITFVQVRAATPGASATTVSATFSAAQAAGNLNVVAIGWGDTLRTVVGVSDSRGNVYAPAVGRTTATGLSHTIWYASNIASAAAGGNTVTVTFSGAASYPDLRILEYAGADPIAPVDGTATGTGAGTASTTSAVVTTGPMDLLFAANVVATTSTGAGAGFTSRIITGDGNIAEDRLASTAGSYTASAALTSGTWVAQLVAFRTARVGDTTAPAAPTGLTATAAGATQINLAWTAATDDVGVTGYQLERCAGSGCTAFAQVLTPSGTTVNDTGLVPALTYSYRVRALDAAGNLGAYSAVATATTPTATVTATVTAASKVYDGGTSATSTTCTLAGVIGSDVVSCAGGAAAFNSPTVGTAKTVTVTGITLSGANAANYSLSSPTATTTATITAALVTATVTVADKPYDGTTSATVTGCTLSGVISGDTVTCAGGTATFDTANVGTGKLVTVTGQTLSGASAVNYTLASTTATATASITAGADTTAPTVPGNPTATAASATQINLAWTASTDNVGVTGYEVERCTGVSCSTFALVQTAAGPAITDAGLTALTTYRYRVRATDAAGNLSGYSTVVTAVTASAPTITFVQVRGAAPGGSATTVSATFSAAQTTGNLNVVAIGWGDTLRTVVSVTDSRGNVYAPAIGRTTTTGLSHTIWYAKNIAGAAAGSNSVTVTFSGAASYPDVRIVEYAGADVTAPVDGTAAGSGSGTASTTAAVVTTKATDLLFAANVVETRTTAPGAGFTSRIISGDGNIAEDRLVTTTGSYAASAALTSGAWIAQLVAFRAAGSQ